MCYIFYSLRRLSVLVRSHILLPKEIAVTTPAFSTVFMLHPYGEPKVLFSAQPIEKKGLWCLCCLRNKLLI